jgi:hypothetical protein
MEIVIILIILAAAIFFFRGMFSLGSAMSSKKLEEELEQARVDIIRSHEQKLFDTAKATYNLNIKKIDEFCKLNHIHSHDRAAKISFAQEFIEWGAKFINQGSKSEKALPSESIVSIDKTKSDKNEDFKNGIRNRFSDLDELTRFGIGLYLYNASVVAGTNINKKSSFGVDIIDMLLAIPANAGVIVSCVNNAAHGGEDAALYKKYIAESSGRINKLDQNKTNTLAYLTLYSLNKFDTTDLSIKEKQFVDYFLLAFFPRIHTLITSKSFNELGKLFNDAI